MRVLASCSACSLLLWLSSASAISTFASGDVCSSLPVGPAPAGNAIAVLRTSVSMAHLRQHKDHTYEVLAAGSVWKKGDG
jgi:hypothetical protein